MRHLWLLLIPLALMVFVPSPAHAQQGNTVTIRFAGAPTGSCSPVAYAVNNATGDFYDCLAGAWHAVGGGGGSGTVTSVGLTVNSTSPSGIFTVTGSPVTTAGTLNFNLAGTSGGIPYFSDGVTLSSSGALASGGVVLGGGAGTTPTTNTALTFSSPTLTVGLAGTSSGILALSGSTSGTATFTAPATAGTRTNAVISSNSLQVGVAGTTGGILGLGGSTSGVATLTAPAVAGTSTNPVISSNVLQVAAGSAASPGYNFTGTGGPASGMYYNVSGTYLAWPINGTNKLLLQTDFRLASTVALTFSSGDPTVNAVDTALSRDSAGVIDVGISATVGNKAGSMNMTNLTASAAVTAGSVSSGTYATATNCANGASPAVCSSAASGVVAVPTGTNPTLTINTTAVTANSRIFLEIDESATIAATTCNTTLSTLVQPVVTARTAGTSFTIQIGAVIATNPACVSYLVMN